VSELVASLLAATGLEAPATGAVQIDGDDPVLPTPFPVGRAAASVAAACGVAVARLWESRGGAPQRARVDVRRAAASLLGFLHLRAEGTGFPSLARELRPTVDLYRARDGRWIHLHGGFEHLARGTLAVLGCTDTHDAIAAAVERREATALEDDLAEAGLCGAVVRSAVEWAAHPQGAALAAHPLVELERIGDAPAEPLAPGPRPLAGVRVLDLTRVLAGPSCGRALAEHGADVLRVDGPDRPYVPVFAVDTGHGKRSARLDLERAEDARRLRELAAGADVFVQVYRTGSLERRGLGAESLAERRPGIVVVCVNCYGHAGPWLERRGWEQLAQSATGLAHEQGEPGRPRLVPAAACDYTTGGLAALGALAALLHRAREGGSWRVRVSLARTAMWLRALEPRCDPAAARPWSPDELAAWCTTSETPWGRLRHLAPLCELSGTPPRWERPVVPLGSDEARWESGGCAG
jgi:crotonobetainyl-CoA:carnitine CoA-transferase CaiB-like acyl-CoA transferase